MTKVWVECGLTGLAIRIFRNKKMAWLHMVNPNRGLAPEPVLREMQKPLATEQIRRQVFERDKYTCQVCGRPVVWERGHENSGEMDEKKSRGTCTLEDDGQYHSGEVSVANGRCLCKDCHTGPGGKHDRHPKFSKGSNASP